MKQAIILLLLFPLSIFAMESDWTVGKDNCTAYSRPTYIDDNAIYLAASITESGSLRGFFLYTMTNGVNPIDGAQAVRINGNDMRFAVTTPTAKTILLEPQEPKDTMYLLQSATTGSLKFNDAVIKTAGAKSTIDYLFENCSN
ncbi:hypothetical protein GWQ29_17475 [Aeromonas sp. 2HA2]|uniref:hypothetical protein n=1 Tax=Aeromonas sp. 2HA2 TaxID=2699194 RepID=UPI0023DD70E7|nr:hypothetical protein [Aeromonas sp. 2HA2]MDF2411189.1 hypothetical protein [Aeromonas sp. 2HA2]